MTADLLQLTALFSGGQLAVAVFVLMELRSLRASHVEMKTEHKEMRQQGEARDKRVAVIDRRVSHIIGRLGITDNETDQE